MRGLGTRRSAALALGLAAALLLGGCGAVSDPEPAGPLLTVHAGTATVTDAEGRVLDDSDRETALPAGATVFATGDDALIELTWPDESVTRLGKDTSFVIGDDDRGAQRGGVTWHRVSEQGSGSYGVTLEDGVLVEAQGTGFVIDCSTGRCSIAVFESEVLAAGTPVSIHTWAEIRDGLPVGHRPLPWSELFGNEWMRKNATLDTPRFVSAQELYRNADPVLAGLWGVFSGHVIKDAFDCEGWPCDAHPIHFELDQELPRSYGFGIECSSGFPCSGTAIIDYLRATTTNITMQEATVPLSFDGAVYSWSLHGEYATCEWPDGTTEGRTSSSTTWEVWPTAAEVIEPGWSWGGDFLVTALEGRAISESRILEPVTTNECRMFEYEATEHSRLFVTLER